MDCCHKHQCKPKCMRKCVGEITKKYRIYKNCCYDVVKVCSCCGQEYNFHRHYMCPRCGAPMDDPPGDPPRVGEFGRVGGFGRRFAPEFEFGGFPGFLPFEEEEFEEFI